MGFFCLNMLNIALELAKHNPTYEDIASKFVPPSSLPPLSLLLLTLADSFPRRVFSLRRFFEHFLFISDAMTFEGPKEESQSLWNEEDGFYYDAISWGPGHTQQIPIHSLVGLIPLYATLTLEPDVIKRFPGFKKRMDWFLENRPELSQRNIANMKSESRAFQIAVAASTSR